MNKIDTTCEHLKLRLIATAVGLQQCERTETNLIPLPGGDRVIAIGTPAEVMRRLSATSLQSLSRASGEERGQQAPQASVEDARERARMAGEAVRNAVWGIIGPGFHARLAALDFATIISGAMSATQEGK